MLETAGRRREAGSEKAVSVRNLRSGRCRLRSAGAGGEIPLLEQGGKTMAKRNKTRTVNGFLNYSDVYM